MNNNRDQVSKKHVSLTLCAVVLFVVIVLLVVISVVYVLPNFGSEQQGNQNATPNGLTCTGNGTILLGVTMSIQDVTPNGLSYTIKNNTLKWYTYGEPYVLYIFQGDSWELVEPIIDNWGFWMIGYSLPIGKTVVESVDWTWLYGELPAGDYKFQKNIVYSRSSGDYDVYSLEQEFSISA